MAIEKETKETEKSTSDQIDENVPASLIDTVAEKAKK